jgi:hypothetical protein
MRGSTAVIKTVMRPVELTVCDACHGKGKDTEAVTKASMGLGGISRTVDLCEEHKGLFVAVMDKLMPTDAGTVSGAEAAAPVAVKEEQEEPKAEAKEDTGLTAVTIPAPVAVQEPAAQSEDTQEEPARVSRHEDLQDYCQRITDSRTAMKGRKLNPATQVARAQWARHRSRFQDICAKEQSHLEDWAEHHGKDVRFTACHVEFRGWLWENFPAKAEQYVAAYRSNTRTPDVKTSDVSDAGTVSGAPTVEIRDNIGRPIVKPETIRAWARENGYKVADRGRIPAVVREAFKATQAA